MLIYVDNDMRQYEYLLVKPSPTDTNMRQDFSAKRGVWSGTAPSESFLCITCHQVPGTQLESERLLAETRAVDVLEAEYAADLDFGGISTSKVTDSSHFGGNMCMASVGSLFVVDTRRCHLKCM